MSRLRPGRQLRRFHRLMLKAFGPQQWWPAESPLEVVAGAYLTQNASWRGVELSIASLKARGLMTLDGLRATPEEELRAIIRPSGSMTRKAASIKAFVAFLDREHSGSLRSLAALPTMDARAQLLALPGVGPETADAILLYALGRPAPVADEYLRRIAVRHGLAPENVKYDALRQMTEDAFAGESAEALRAHFSEFHALVVETGKRHCRKRPQCAGCPLEPLLPVQSACPAPPAR